VRFWKTVAFSGLQGLIFFAQVCTKQANAALNFEKTANALNDNIVSVMLLAVREQKGNLELSMTVAKSVFSYRMVGIKKCLQFTMGLAECLEVGGREGKNNWQMRGGVSLYVDLCETCCLFVLFTAG
jgi:hypothetical protein